jgi:peptidyl-dipeptidase A
MRRIIAAAACFVVLMSCGTGSSPTAADAKKFLDESQVRIDKMSLEAAQASWIQANFITDDTEAQSARVSQRMNELLVELAKGATKFDGVTLPPDQARMMKLLKLTLTQPAPADAKESEELSKLAAKMEGVYGKGKYCRETAPAGQEKCLAIGEITKIMATSRNAKELLDVWEGWHTISPPIKADYARFVQLANKGAKELGYADSGAMWRSKYDMAPDEFAKEIDRLWEQVKPLYLSLHTYVRGKLHAKYGDVVPPNGPIPAHLLGNIWAQEWDNIYDLVKPGSADAGYDLTAILKGKKTTDQEMVKYGERFFTSLGFDPLPKTFWERSLFVKPRDREVVCHASAWDLDNVDDLRIKMCIEPTSEDFTTIHHELGHNFYQRAYNKLPIIFRDSANDGFHEAIGDTIALSVTPEYLVKVGLLTKAPDESRDIGLLMHRALDGVAFLPFGLLIDQWRWKVFSGEVTPDTYNKAWWDLRLKYQGIAPAGDRGAAAFFDPGAKYHVPANVPYTRYFLARILQFQFHRALAKEAGCTQPLHRCSIYDNKAAGKKLISMLEMGVSKPWQEALQSMTGSDKMDATAIVDYFAPLKKWLDEQNKGLPSGW